MVAPDMVAPSRAANGPRQRRRSTIARSVTPDDLRVTHGLGARPSVLALEFPDSAMSMTIPTISRSLLPALLAAAATAQGFVALPATAGPDNELPQFSLLPFMQPNARVQMFYGQSETGSLPLVVDQISFRYDGPIPQVGAPGPFALQRLEVRIGTTAVATPGAEFAANLTQPLTTVFDGPWSYLPDPGSAFPHPWGGPNGSLTFPFSAAVPIVVGAGEWLVVDITMTGNNIASFGFAHAILDGATTTGGVTDGTAAAYGQGCATAPGQPSATVATTGMRAPGGAHFLTGQNLGAGAPVLGIWGLSNTMAFAPLPFTLPGTNCDLLASPDFTQATFADAAGAVTGTQLALSLPADPAISGIVLYEQLASLVAGANAWGIVFSNAAAVTLGNFAPLGRQTYSVAHDVSATAPYGNIVRPFGYALRLHTL
jgi:hypothetical protein